MDRLEFTTEPQEFPDPASARDSMQYARLAPATRCRAACDSCRRFTWTSIASSKASSAAFRHPPPGTTSRRRGPMDRCSIIEWRAALPRVAELSPRTRKPASSNCITTALGLHHIAEAMKCEWRTLRGRATALLHSLMRLRSRAWQR